jgi:hypothetical protein
MKKHLPAFSLLEISIALMVIGILMIGALKGKDLIDAARLHRLAGDLQTYQLATLRFYEMFQALPGDFDQASLRIKIGLQDGNGNGVIEGDGLESGSEAYQAWAHLGAAKLVEVHKPPSIFGAGYITFKANPRADLSGTWLQLSRLQGGGIFTPRQTQALLEKVGYNQAIPGNGTGSVDCLLGDGSLNTKVDRPVCVLFVALNI